MVDSYLDEVSLARAIRACDATLALGLEFDFVTDYLDWVALTRALRARALPPRPPRRGPKLRMKRYRFIRPMPSVRRRIVSDLFTSFYDDPSPLLEQGTGAFDEAVSAQFFCAWHRQLLFMKLVRKASLAEADLVD